MADLRLVQGGIDPLQTESLLLSQEGVVDASVWYSKGELHAQVTIDDEAGLSQIDLQGVCVEALGVHQTPRSMTIIQARRRAA